jgi:hypothetical protein
VNRFRLPLIHSYKPATFQDRGVAVPFTTPQLAGSRVRPARRTGIEFIVPNPSGGRGVYVLEWDGVRQLCRPTVHDTLLSRRLGGLEGLDPRGVRLIVLALAAEGMAGKQAAAAARAATIAAAKEQVLLNFLMLILLMEQIEPTGLRVSAETERTPELDRRARRLVTRYATAAGRHVNQVSADLETLSGLFLAVGLEPGMPPARLPRLNTRLAAVADSLTEWAGSMPEDGFTAVAASLADSTRVAASYAAATLGSAWAMAGDIRGLLGAWATAPDEITRQVSRPDWILDGWERFCLLWEAPGPTSARRATLQEMTQIMPHLPREAAEWVGSATTETSVPGPATHGPRVNESWRGGGASFGLIARNEHLQALIE